MKEANLINNSDRRDVLSEMKPVTLEYQFEIEEDDPSTETTPRPEAPTSQEDQEDYEIELVINQNRIKSLWNEVIQ